MKIRINETGQVKRFKEWEYDNILNWLRMWYGDIKVLRHHHNKSKMIVKNDDTCLATIKCTANQSARLAEKIMIY